MTRPRSRPGTAKRWATLRGHVRLVKGVTFAPDASLLAVASDDRRVRLWNPERGRLVRELTGHAAPVVSVSFAPDGRLLACGSHSRRRAVPDEISPWDPAGGARRNSAGPVMPGRCPHSSSRPTGGPW